jgi:outer membrane protein OmpA-like peptidoglycan-associated protein
MKLRLALAVATCLTLPLVAHAQPVTGPYVSLGAGTSLLNPVNYSFPVPNAYGKFLSRPSYAAVGSVGYGFGDGFRIELGGNFYRNTFHEDDNINGSHARIFGGQDTFGPMVNVLYDFNVGLPIFPYVGAGIGYQWADLSGPINDTNGKSGDYVSGTQGSFAYQAIAGLSYPIDMVPGLSVTAEYRFMQLVSNRKYSAYYYDGKAFSDGPATLGQESSNTFLLGLRYQIFNAPEAAPAPAPAPMAAPAPAPSRTYLVFFDWDKYNLTPRATQIIAEAASDSKTQTTTTLDVSGYTDTSGTPVYNQGLSLRRAKSVAAQLVADGVPGSEIEIHAYGETHLLVPTGPGVREPQNRRVEIVLN